MTTADQSITMHLDTYLSLDTWPHVVLISGQLTKRRQHKQVKGDSCRYWIARETKHQPGLSSTWVGNGGKRRWFPGVGSVGQTGIMDHGSWIK